MSGTVASRVSRLSKARPFWFLVSLLALAAVAAVVVPKAYALAFADDPCGEADDGSRVCPVGAVDTHYSIQLKGRSGCEPYHKFRVLSGSLPPGLSLASSGQLSGTPTHAGGWRAYLEVSDQGPEDGGPEWCTVVKQSEREFLFVIQAGLVVATASTPEAALGAPYSTTLTAAMKTGPDQTQPTPSPATWSVVDGQLPPGLALAANGVIAGTPTAQGAYGFTVRATLASGASATRPLAIEVRAAPLTLAAPQAISRTEVGLLVRIPLGVTGGTPPYTWTLAGGALPTGVALTPAGVILGKPTEAGIFRFTASVNDAGGQSLSHSSVLRVAPRLAIAFITTRPTGVVGRRYRARIPATGGVAPRQWSIVRGQLPPGITIHRQRGLLTGTPRRPGRYRAWIRVEDALGVRSTRAVVINVIAPRKRTR
jgi:hypothetical protein